MFFNFIISFNGLLKPVLVGISIISKTERKRERLTKNNAEKERGMLKEDRLKGSRILEKSKGKYD